MNWNIEQLWVKPTESNLSNVVITAAWRCSGEQNYNGHKLYGTCYGTASFEAPNPSDFIPYTNLKLSDVLGWVWSSGVDKSAIELNVQQQIDNQINPPVMTLPIPWN